MNKNINVYDLGVLDYKTALNFQEKKLQEIIDIKRTNRNEGSSIETPNYFLFVEHPPVITLGKSGQEKNLLLKTYKFNCRSCGNQKLKRVISLGYQPLANNLLKKTNEKCELYPLEVNFCQKCIKEKST